MKLFAPLLLISSQASALGCPAEINDKQTLVRPDSSWEVKSAKGPRYLESTSVSVGHPSKFQFIAASKDEGYRQVWSLNRSKDVWLECNYAKSAYTLVVHVGRVSECSYFKKNIKVHGGAYFSCKK